MPYAVCCTTIYTPAYVFVIVIIIMYVLCCVLTIVSLLSIIITITIAVCSIAVRYGSICRMIQPWCARNGLYGEDDKRTRTRAAGTKTKNGLYCCGGDDNELIVSRLWLRLRLRLRLWHNCGVIVIVIVIVIVVVVENMLLPVARIQVVLVLFLPQYKYGCTRMQQTGSV